MADPTQQPNDFHLHPLQSTPDAPVDATQGQTTQTAQPIATINLNTGMSSNDIVIAGVLLLVLAVVFFFVRGGVRRHLIAERASLSAASNAGWALFAFLFSLSVMVVFGLIGDVWRIPTFMAPMAGLVLATLAVTIFTYRGALRRRR